MAASQGPMRGRKGPRERTIDMRRVALLLVSALAATGLVRADEIDNVIQREMAAQHIPAVALLVARDGKTVDTRAYGEVDLERGAKARPQNIFEIGSITKQFTAAGIMMLRDEGKLSVDDPAVKYLPELPEKWRAVTLYQLLTHTAGVPNITAQPTFHWDRDYTYEEGMALIRNLPLDFPPGSKWQYSNTGYVLLGRVIEKVSGQSYGDFIAARIFKPLGMTSSRIAGPRAIIKDRALGYAWDGNTLWNAPLLHAIAGGAGAILSTVQDLAQWDASLDTHRLLKKSTLDEMWTPARLVGGGTYPYGFGWAIGDRNGHPVVDHGGGTPGFGTIIRRFLPDKLTVIIFSNRGGADTGRIADEVSRVVEPSLRPSATPPVKDPDPAFTTRLTGIVRSLLSDTPDLTPFTPRMAAALTPAMLSTVRQQVGALGPLKSLAFLRETDTPAGKSRDYRATFGDTPLTVNAVVQDDGKIAGLWVRP